MTRRYSREGISRFHEGHRRADIGATGEDEDCRPTETEGSAATNSRPRLFHQRLRSAAVGFYAGRLSRSGPTRGHRCSITRTILQGDPQIRVGLELARINGISSAAPNGDVGICTFTRPGPYSTMVSATISRSTRVDSSLRRLAGRRRHWCNRLLLNPGLPRTPSTTRKSRVPRFTPTKRLGTMPSRYWSCRMSNYEDLSLAETSGAIAV